LPQVVISSAPTGGASNLQLFFTTAQNDTGQTYLPITATRSLINSGHGAGEPQPCGLDSDHSRGWGSGLISGKWYNELVSVSGTGGEFMIGFGSAANWANEYTLHLRLAKSTASFDQNTTNMILSRRVTLGTIYRLWIDLDDGTVGSATDGGTEYESSIDSTILAAYQTDGAVPAYTLYDGNQHIMPLPPIVHQYSPPSGYTAGWGDP
jgi:hypothetical protein